MRRNPTITPGLNKAHGIIVYGPQGCGKTTHAAALAAHYGKSRIVDDWEQGGRLDGDTLALTNVPHAGTMSFLDAVADAGIKLSPRHVAAIRTHSKLA